MEEKGVKSVELAERLGVTKQTISNLINGKVMPSIDTIDRVAEALDVEFWQLFAPDGIGKVADTSSCPHIICPKCGHHITIKAE